MISFARALKHWHDNRKAARDERKLAVKKELASMARLWLDSNESLETFLVMFELSQDQFKLVYCKSWQNPFLWLWVSNQIERKVTSFAFPLTVALVGAVSLLLPAGIPRLGAAAFQFIILGFQIFATNRMLVARRAMYYLDVEAFEGKQK